MFLRKVIAVKPSFTDGNVMSNRIRLICTAYATNFKSYQAIQTNCKLCLMKQEDVSQRKPFSTLLSLQRRLYSSGAKEDNATKIEKDLNYVSSLYPQPRVTLNEFTSKTPQKVFDIYFKQNTISNKGRKKITQSDWTCTYTFIWPEKIKFESTAISKRQAADKAAMQALYYLYSNKRIDSKGCPVYDSEVLHDLKSTLNDPLRACMSENSTERLNNIWDYYEEDIKKIYEETFHQARKRLIRASAVLNDSSLDKEDGFPDDDLDPRLDADDFSEQKIPVHPVYGKNISPPTQATLAQRDKTLLRTFEEYNKNITPLPIDEYVDKITSTLRSSQVVILVGAAGCGKSTRAPAAILREFGAKTSAIVSEPRRVAAIGLAERVANEMGEEVGESIGYQVRLRSNPPQPPAGSILYCTSGVLLRRLQSNPGLKGCTHVFIDEAHERDVNTDVTLCLLKRALRLNSDLRVVVMSATIDAKVFTEYFDNCPIIEVPGRTFPVTVTYLDEIQKKFKVKLSNATENCQRDDGRPQINCQEVVELIRAVDKNNSDGAILVFLPGWAEIKHCKKLLDTQLDDASYLILPVHSRLSTTEQGMMFTKPMPGVRKIVLSTNIAETSVTIPDVVYVIDSGAHKENRLKEGTGMASLETVWVSKAGAKQRTGRAGRVQPGHCYRMYTKEKESEFLPHTTPEILRIPLETTVLDCKTYAPNDKAEYFLSQLPEPPSRRSIRFAVNDLIDLGAITKSEQLTRLGSLLSQISLHPRLARCVLNARVANCVFPTVNVVTHCGSNFEIFHNSTDRREEIREIKRSFSSNSDHVALHRIQEQYETKLSLTKRNRTSVDDWCQKYGLRKDALRHIQSLSNLYLQQLLKSDIMGPDPNPEELNRFSNVDELITGVLLSGSNSLITTKRMVKTKGRLATVTELFTSKGERAHIGSESINNSIVKTSQTNKLISYFGGYHSTERRALVVYKTSTVTPEMALLFTTGDVVKESGTNDDESVLYLPRHRLRIQIPSIQADIIVRARKMLWDTFQYYVERDKTTIDYDENTKISRFNIKLFKCISKILVIANKGKLNDSDELDELTE